MSESDGQNDRAEERKEKRKRLSKSKKQYDESKEE
jgi:hypothetical protein